MQSRAFGAIVAAALIAAAGAARADDRVVLVGPPAVLTRAAIEQLTPWHIAVVVADGAGPVTTDDARALAAAHGARAVAWLDGDALVVFDVARGTLARRPAAAALDDVAAAAMALTLKTTLREQWAADDARAAAAPPPPPPPPRAEPAPPRWGLGVATGLRLRGGDLEPRITALADVRLGELAVGGAALPLAIGLRGALGGGVSIAAPRYRGTWVDRAAGAVVLAPLVRGPVAVSAGAGGSLHATRIRGVVLPGTGAGNASAVNLGVDGEVTVAWRRPPVELGLRLAATWVPFRQRYTVADVAVYEVSHLEVETGFAVIFTF